MIFEQVSTGGCRSYLVGCPEMCVGALIDPQASQIDHYKALASRLGVRVAYVIDTHTHADHFSGAERIARALGAPVVMHWTSPAPFVDLRLDDGDVLMVGKLRVQAMHTPGHTADSMCLVLDDRVFTGDTLLIGGTGRTDLPSGDPVKLYESLFEKLLRLPPETLVYPAHDYKGRDCSTIGEELSTNPRLQAKEEAGFVAMMNTLNLSMPTHLTEALRTNMSGGKTVAELLSEAAARIAFIGAAELDRRLREGANDLLVLDVREAEAWRAGHIPGSHCLPRGQLELRVNQELPDPTRRIVVACEYGKVSTLAAATLRELGFPRAVGLDGGMKAWRDLSLPIEIDA
jgi:glyoxylase-like metal-dependent hydrolase (beta-lactamase superfamily II)/rhodanese-related sulfurtransferase